MGPAIGIGAGALLGAVKHNQEKAAYNRQKEMAAQVQQYSPWSNLNGSQFMPQQAPNQFGSLFQGGLAGGMLGASLGGGPKAPAAPMAGATQMGQGSMMSPDGLVPSNGMNMFAGGYESPWQRVPTFYG